MSESIDIGTVEQIDRDDWDGVNDPCPNCDSKYFELVDYNTTIYEDGDSINDRWDKTGTLLVKCKTCGTVLHKDAAYEVLKEQYEMPP